MAVASGSDLMYEGQLRRHCGKTVALRRWLLGWLGAAAMGRM